MAGSINKVTLMGRLGADPESRKFSNGGQVVNMRVATSETWKDKQSGERRERTEWHSVAIFNEGLCRVALNFLKKGSRVYLEGQLETRKWQDQQGQDRYSTEIVLRPYKSELVLMDKRSDSEGGSNGGHGGGYRDSNPAPRSNQSPAPRQNGPDYGSAQHQGYPPYGQRPLSLEHDDDIPF